MNDSIPLLGFNTTPLELSAFVLAALTVYLNIRQNHWAWLFAIVSSATYAVVFYGARLYGDMALQVVFIAVSTWGWYQWLFGGEQHTPLMVSWLDRRGWSACLLAWAAGFALLAWFLRSYTNTDVPNIDAFLTAGSLVGQVLVARKKIENWMVWIVVDVLYVGLYVYKSLMLTAILYFVFIIMAVVGLVAWRRSAREAA
jgi:nicotinamide mononucleotide transporter